MVRFIESNNMSDLWEDAYKLLIEQGETSPSRAGKVKHLTNITLILTNPLQNIVYSNIRKLSPRYLAAELYWYLEGRNDLEYIGKYASLWKSLSDDGETVNSAYGYVMSQKYGFNQLHQAIAKLTNDPTTRQAIIHFKAPSNKKSKDVMCTVSIQFMVSHGKLNAHTYMRSNDVWFGTPYDIAFFTTLLQIVSHYTRIPLGEYHHTVGDFHVYTKNIVSGQNTVEKWGGVKPDFEYNEYLKNALEQYADGQGNVFTPKALYTLEDIINENKN